MLNKKAKCQDVAAGLPGGLGVESFIDSPVGECLVGHSGTALHIVRIQNRTLLRFEISITAECETPHIRYLDDSEQWDESFTVSHRPQPGGPRDRMASANLKSSEKAVDESVKITVNYNAIGCVCEGSSVMQLQMDAGD